MKSTYFKIFVVFSLSLVVMGSGHLAFGQSRPLEPYRILIDASKDGGLWWFPQAGHFDAEQPHQGKIFADSLRQDGAEVVELGRGETITTDRLRGFDLVIRVPAFFTYSPSEANAYRYIVAGGTRLLIIGGATPNPDRVAEAFGLKFEKRAHFSSLKRWVPHPFFPAFGEDSESAWSGVVGVPNEAVVLGWINNSKETPVQGYLPYGQGYVVFTGRAITLGRNGPSFSKALINSIAIFSLRDLMLMPTAEVVTAQVPLVGGPILIEPQSNSTLPQPGDGEWRFDWEDVPGSERYEIVILGPHASTPLARVITSKSEITLGKRLPGSDVDRSKAGYIADHNLRGWSWRVRAKLIDGTWGAWSREKRFNIQIRNK